MAPQNEQHRQGDIAMRGYSVIRSRKARMSALKYLLLAVPISGVHAQAPPQMNVVYACKPPYSFKFLSCTGTSATDWCDVQSFNAGPLAELPSADAGRGPG